MATIRECQELAMEFLYGHEAGKRVLTDGERVEIIALARRLKDRGGQVMAVRCGSMMRC